MNKDKLLDNVITAIKKWQDGCKAEGESPICISHFVSLSSKIGKSSKTKYAIFGEQSAVMDLLTYTNRLLDPKDGEESLIK